VPQLPLFSPAPSERLQLLDSVEPDRLSPKEALELIYRLKAMKA
jgi:DNA mismatch repair protein MutS